MYFKRFAQLFIIFVVALAIFSLVLEARFGNFWLRFILGVVIAYALLTLPLVILTITKARKKENIVGTQSAKGELAEKLKDLPGFIALAVTGTDGRTATTIMSFTQSVVADNVLWMVAGKDTTKVAALTENPSVSFTTWFDSFDKGSRLSSNRARVEVLTDVAANKKLTASEPNILDIHENAVNMAILKLSVDSVMYEDFKDGIKVLDFTK